MSPKRAILAGVGLGYGAFVLVTSPTVQFIRGVRAVRSLQATIETMADETLDYFGEYAGEILGIKNEDR